MPGGRLVIALLLGGLLLPLTPSGAKPRTADAGPADSPAGEAIYLQGVLESGAPLTGTRANAEPSRGQAAACVNCHRRSGFGAREGRNIIPPISGRFLFDARDSGHVYEQLPYIPGERLDRTPYTPATFSRALREGIDSEGKILSYLMPRFALDDADLNALIAHLRALDRRKVPGVSPVELQFATIITPDADPIKRRGMLDVLQQFVQDRNLAPRGPGAQTMNTSGATAHVRSMFRVNRRWVLHVWELTGAADTWGAQLDQKMAEQPVFAVLSGLAGKSWQPVADFCERRAVPCLFPNVEDPPADSDQRFHTLYFSRGVLLEADLIAAGIARDAPTGAAVTRVRLLYRAGDVGEAAAPYLAAKLRAQGLAVSSQAIARNGANEALIEGVRAASGEVLVLWLRPADLTALQGADAPQGPVYLSGLMGGLDAAPLPADWRERVRMAYPLDLANRRRVRVDYALGWFRIRNIPVVSEQVQVDTYLACGLLSETLKHMVDAFVPDYLIEQLEDTVEHHLLTGYYPRLTLGPHQRFASKGGFLTRYDAAGKPGMIADGDWLTP
jgi:hypothetical protein